MCLFVFKRYASDISKVSEFKSHLDYLYQPCKKFVKIVKNQAAFQKNILPLYLNFEKLSSTNWIFSLQKSILKSFINTCIKNPVQNRLKIQFIQLDFSQLIFPNWFFQIDFSELIFPNWFSEIKYRSTGGMHSSALQAYAFSWLY